MLLRYAATSTPSPRPPPPVRPHSCKRCMCRAEIAARGGERCDCNWRRGLEQLWARKPGRKPKKTAPATRKQPQKKHHHPKSGGERAAGGDGAETGAAGGRGRGPLPLREWQAAGGAGGAAVSARVTNGHNGPAASPARGSTARGGAVRFGPHLR